MAKKINRANKGEQTEEEEAPRTEDKGRLLVDLDEFLAGEEDPLKIRMLSLHGEINEETAAELVYALMLLHHTGHYKEHKEAVSEDAELELETKYRPIELLISTHGGLAAEMFSIYDTIRMLRDQCEITTFGIGKVMSGGVLLLASGTKGKRKIMKNCRVMMHSVIGASHGDLHSLENEMDEIRYLQEQHIKCLVEETNMTKKYLTKLMNRTVNVYLTAAKAVELGIADEIV